MSLQDRGEYLNFLKKSHGEALKEEERRHRFLAEKHCDLIQSISYVMNKVHGSAQTHFVSSIFYGLFRVIDYSCQIRLVCLTTRCNLVRRTITGRHSRREFMVMSNALWEDLGREIFITTDRQLRRAKTEFLQISHQQIVRLNSGLPAFFFFFLITPS